METNSSIRQCFRHNTDNNDLPKPIFARQVNGPDAPIINSKNKHNKLMKLLGDELSAKYIQYNQGPLNPD
jgi:hypothetical protein